MAETYSLAAKKRVATKTSAKEVRSEARIPAVVYGSSVENTPVSVDASEMLKLYRRAGTAAVIELEIEGKKTKVLIHELTLHPVRDEIYHIDFYAVNMKEVTIVTVPLIFEGEAPAIKNQVGTFMTEHDTLEIRCLPSDIPHEIKVDISGLTEIHDHVTIKDLNLDLDKFELMGALDESVVLCSITGRSVAESDEPMEEIETEAAAGAPVEEEGESKESNAGGEEKSAE